MADLSFRGIPYTGGIADPHAKQVLDAVIENLRRGNLSVAASGLVYSGSSAPALTPASQLNQLGGAYRLGIDFAQTNLRLKTLAATAPLTIADEGNRLTFAIAPDALEGVDSFKVICDAADDFATAGALNAKLVDNATGDVFMLVHDAVNKRMVVKSLTQGDGIALTDVLGSALIAANLVEGDGITLDTDPETGAITITSDAVDHKVCLWGTAEAMPQDAAGYLVDKLVSNAVDPEMSILGLDTVNEVMVGRGLVGGIGMDLHAGAEDTDGLGPIYFDFFPKALQTATIDATGQTLVVYDVATDAAAQVAFGDAAGRDAGTGAEQVAFGNHGHVGLPTGGTEGDVWYHDGSGWVASSLATLVRNAIYDLADFGEPVDGDEVLARRVSDASMGWADAKECVEA